MLAVNELLGLLKRIHVLDSEQLAQAKSIAAQSPDAKTLAKQLIERGWLTPYQANQLLTGHGDGLLLGSFVLLEKLGQGGMGAVFKARNWRLDRIVAVKLIRKERLSSVDAVKRFHREIRAAAQLQHPNIVAVFDADEVNGTHYMAMEYVEGEDLSEYAKKHGKLPIDKACDFICQAAIGLHHAYERGLVHRDIKPANLFLTDDGVVKILDMGLARIEHTDDDHSASLTAEGTIMGTPDYIAPEQAVDSKGVDIRADIYSLGCSLYYLLSGKVPFPGGTLMEKLMRHQMEQPTPIQQLRPDVPYELAAVIKAMMAKNPVDRMQTPAEVVEALTGIEKRAAPEAVSSTAATVGMPGLKRAGNSLFAFGDSNTHEGIVKSSKCQSDTIMDPQVKRWWIMVIGGLAGLLVLALVGVIALMNSGGETPEKPRVVKNNKDAPITPIEATKDVKSDFDEWLAKTKTLPANEKLKAVLERMKLHNPLFDGDAESKIEDAKVVMLKLGRHHVQDLSPLSALTQLGHLAVSGESGRDDSPPVSLTPLSKLPLFRLEFSNFRIHGLKPIEHLKLSDLTIHQCSVTDWAVLAKMPLERIVINGEANVEINALTNPTLKFLYLGHCGIDDLSPLSSLPLTKLGVGNTKARDLRPLRNMRLKSLDITNTLVRDVRPLAKMPIAFLYIENTPVTDFTPLTTLPLESIKLTFQYERDVEWLKKISTLKRINEKPVAEFWKVVEAERAKFQQLCDRLAMLGPAGQKAAVEGRLQNRNPGFKRGIKITETENGQITGIEVADENLQDIKPLRALKHLRKLTAGKFGMRTKITSLWPLKGLPLEHLDVRSSRVFDLRPLSGMPLKELVIYQCPVRDLAPLKGLPLRLLYASESEIEDLGPLQGLPLEILFVTTTKVRDLTPLKGVKLKSLAIGKTAVEDLSPLQGMQLQSLNCTHAPVRDIGVLRGMPIQDLILSATHVKDFTPLNGLPLNHLDISYTAAKDLVLKKGIPFKFLQLTETSVKAAPLLTEFSLDTYNGPIWPLDTLQALIKHPTLKLINNLQPDAFRKKYEPWAKWMEMVRNLPAEKQVDAVAKKLQEVNPGFDGKLESKTENGQVRSLTIKSDDVGHLTPLLAVPNLTDLTLDGVNHLRSKFRDLDILKWVPLKDLVLTGTGATDIEALRFLPLKQLMIVSYSVMDLAPIGDTPLETLSISGLGFKDLTPIANLKLKKIHMDTTNVSDLSPLRNMPLAEIRLRRCDQVWDLTPLAKLPLRRLNLNQTPILSYKPIQQMQLELIRLDFEYERDAKWLRAMKSLQYINYESANVFWKKIDAKRAIFENWKKQVASLPAEEQWKAVIAKLKELNPGYDGKAPEYTVKNGEISRLELRGRIQDITPVAALTKLQTFGCSATRSVRSLWPLRHLKLTHLNCAFCPVFDLEPLRLMPLTGLLCYQTNVRDFRPLQKTPLKVLHCDFDPHRDTAVLKSMPKLETINGMPAAEFWKKHGTAK